MGTQQLGAMRADVARIAELRQAPRAAVARTRPSEELLAPIERTLTAAGVDHGRWRDSIPDPPVRLPQSDHRRLRTIVLMERFTLQRLAALAHLLKGNDPTLTVTAINLNPARDDSAAFDVERAVSHRVFAPHGRSLRLRRTIVG